MPFEIIRHDITKVAVDAIVNAANTSLLGGGGVDGCIHAAAGPELLSECRKLGGCKTGDAKLTRAYRLPAKYIIHAVGPIWQGGSHGERELLASCYRRSLELAAKKWCKSIAFPLISSGVYGYPKAEALAVACETIRAFLEKREMQVYLVIYDRDTLELGETLTAGIAQFIDDHYVDAHKKIEHRRLDVEAMPDNVCLSADAPEDAPMYSAAPMPSAAPMRSCAAPSISLDDAVSRLDASFSEKLLRLIDESGMTDAQCYKKANIDRKLFSKIRSSKSYRPGKSTVLAFAIALELPLDATRELLESAGYALSKSSRADVIVEYFIRKGQFDIFEINAALFAYDEPQLA